MKLSEKSKDYFVILEQCAKTKSEIEKKLLDIVQILEYFATEIIDFSYSDREQIDVNYYYRCHDEYDIDNCSIPIEWLDLDNESLRDIIRKREDEKERKEYERLKKKFGGK